jgi:nucleoside-diphosphate-sugar epimerase
MAISKTPLHRRKVLVVGARSFIGSHLLAMKQSHQDLDVDLVFFDRPDDMDFTTNHGRFRFLDTFEYEEVVLLSWKKTGSASYDEGAMHNRWLRATVKIVEALDRRGAKCWIMGAGTNAERAAQTTDYARSKLQVREIFLDKWVDRHSFIDLPYIYSLFHGRPRLVGAMIEAHHLGRNFAMNNPDLRHDYVEIRDVCHQILSRVDSGQAGLHQVTSHQTISNRELIEYARSKTLQTKEMDCSCIQATGSRLSDELRFTQDLLSFASSNLTEPPIDSQPRRGN